MNYIIPIILSLLFLIIMLAPAITMIKVYEYKNKNKKSPLNIQLLRPPGYSLQEKINDLTFDLLENLFSLPVIPFLFFSTAVSTYVLDKKTPSIFIILFYLAISILSIIYFSRQIFINLKKRNLYRLGFECETAAGQDLQYSLATREFKVFHDFPASNFNIDHIVVGPTGVFAVETKGRTKPLNKKNDNWIVEFNGEKLIFPGWEEKKPILQAKRQAQWLEGWIKKATAEQITVTPVLCLPGWFVQKKVKSEFLIYNGKNSNFLEKRPVSLNKNQIQRIVFQIEKECRNIKPRSYQKLPKT